MKYIEFGIGNRWVLRTETEYPDGTETERKGADWPRGVRSVYLRLWVGKKVFILDTREGAKRQQKNRKAFKLLLGIQCED